MKKLTTLRLLCITSVLCLSLLPLHASADPKGKHESSDTGFQIVDHPKLDPQKFDADKNIESGDKEVRELAKKIKDKKVNLCKTVWNEKGPVTEPEKVEWIFSCEGECKEKGHACEIQVIWNGGTPEAKTLEKFKFAGGTAGKTEQSVTASPGLFRKHVLAVYCECKKKRE